MRTWLKQAFVHLGALVVILVVSPVVFLFLHGACGSSGPTARDDPDRPEKSINVTLRNNDATERVHILTVGLSRPTNGLNAGDSLTTNVLVAVDDVERFHAENDLRGEITAESCGPVTAASYDRATGFRVVYANSTLTCFGWR